MNQRKGLYYKPASEEVYIIDLFDINLCYGTLPFREEVYNLDLVKVYIEFSN